jgi:hypothetical protein
VVLNALGHMESRSKVKTKAENICDFFRGLSGKVEVVFKEGTHFAWLHKLIKPLVASVTVCDPSHNKLIEGGNKSRITAPCGRLAAERDELYGCASPKLDSPVFSTTSLVILLPTIFQFRVVNFVINFFTCLMSQAASEIRF